MDNDIKRFTRLTAILVQLLSKKIVTSAKLAEKFEVSVRTIYRDIKNLEAAGIPILLEEGKGYSLMEGFKIPPIMLTESEANSLLTAELIIQSSKDTSLIEEFASVTAKVKAVLPNTIKRKTEKLEAKMGVSNTYIDKSPKSNILLTLQNTIVEHLMVVIDYKNKNGEKSTRKIEPFAVYANQNNEWILIAFCRLKKDFRSFSLLSVEKLKVTDDIFEPHQLTLEQYLNKTYNNSSQKKSN